MLHGAEVPVGGARREAAAVLQGTGRVRRARKGGKGGRETGSSSRLEKSDSGILGKLSSGPLKAPSDMRARPLSSSVSFAASIVDQAPLIVPRSRWLPTRSELPSGPTFLSRLPDKPGSEERLRGQGTADGVAVGRQYLTCPIATPSAVPSPRSRSYELNRSPDSHWASPLGCLSTRRSPIEALDSLEATLCLRLVRAEPGGDTGEGLR